MAESKLDFTYTPASGGYKLTVFDAERYSISSSDGVHQITGDVKISGDVYVGTNATTNAKSIFNSKPPGASAYRSTTQSLSAATWTSLSLDTQVWDTGDCFAPTDSKFYPPVAGTYGIEGNVSITYTGAAFQVFLRVMKTGTAIYSMARSPEYPSGAADGLLYLHAEGICLDPADDDYLEVQVYCTQAGTINAALSDNLSKNSVRFWRMA